MTARLAVIAAPGVAVAVGLVGVHLRRYAYAYVLGIRHEITRLRLAAARRRYEGARRAPNPYIGTRRAGAR